MIYIGNVTTYNEHNGLGFRVDNGKLVGLDNIGHVKNVFIPSVLPSGEIIKTLGVSFYSGEDGIEQLTVDDAIPYVEPYAFAYSRISKVKWSSSCKTIPECCFYCGFVNEISNIQDVSVIEDGAFQESGITLFSWPSKCKIIPDFCFSGAPLKEISGIDAVEDIRSYAFFNSDIKEFKWPKACRTIPKSCFCTSSLEYITGIENIEQIQEFAFADSSIKKIDLSGTSILAIPPSAFFGVNKENITLSYYSLDMSEEGPLDQDEQMLPF